MKRAITISILTILCFGCSKTIVEEREQPVANRLHNTLNSIALVVMSNSNSLNAADFHAFISKCAERDPLIKELLTKRPDAKSASLLLLNTNMNAWLRPKMHGSEIAIISPDYIKNDGKYIGLAVRFDDEIVYFTYLADDANSTRQR